MSEDSEDLMKIKTTIENMNKFNQVGILKLIASKDSITINENNNGVFINLSDLNSENLQEVIDYIAYVNEQELDLNLQEEIKQEYKSVFFNDKEFVNSITSDTSVKTRTKIISKCKQDKDNNIKSNIYNVNEASST
jgi:hypothetical protein